MLASALPRTRYPGQLWLWPGSALYVGPSLQLGAHSGSVSCLAVAVNGTFTVEQAGTPGPVTRSALIPARITHRIVSEADRMAFCYLDPGSVWHHRCHSAMTRGGVIAYDHKQIAALAAAAAVLRRTRDARAWLELACPQEVVTDSPSADPGGRVRSDARIEWTLSSLQAADLHSDLSATALATQAGLSTSRFLHLFRQHTGTSLRRHRSWLRMISAARRVRDGADLTTAAMDAGFASPSHFSTSFHAMFGVPAKHLLGVQIHLEADDKPELPTHPASSVHYNRRPDMHREEALAQRCWPTSKR